MPSAYQLKQAQEREEAREKARQRGDIHQAGGGGGFADYFSNENREKPVKRGEILGLLEMLEYSRRAYVWWRVLGRWVTRTPAPMNLPRQMSRAYWKNTLQPALAAIQEKLERDAKAANDAAATP